MGYLNSRKQREKLVHPAASGPKLNAEIRKDPYWNPYSSMYL